MGKSSEEIREQLEQLRERAETIHQALRYVTEEMARHVDDLDRDLRQLTVRFITSKLPTVPPAAEGEPVTFQLAELAPVPSHDRGSQ